MNFIDLHTHTTSSDGTYTPNELAKYAILKKLSAIAITDHDTISGIEEAKKSAIGSPLEIISGIEISSNYNSKEIHILGLLIDHKDTHLINHLQQMQLERENRNLKMVDKIKSLGYKISYTELLNESNGNIITRAHFARSLYDTNQISSMKDAFDNIIGFGCPAYIERDTIGYKDAIELIVKSRGIPILAHPLLYNLSDRELKQLVKTLSENGLKGLETIYHCFSKSQTNYLYNIAVNNNLLITGGSDFHGRNRAEVDLGKCKVPYKILKDLKKSHESLYSK